MPRKKLHETVPCKHCGDPVELNTHTRYMLRSGMRDGLLHKRCVGIYLSQRNDPMGRKPAKPQAPRKPRYVAPLTAPCAYCLKPIQLSKQQKTNLRHGKQVVHNGACRIAWLNRRDSQEKAREKKQAKLRGKHGAFESSPVIQKSTLTLMCANQECRQLFTKNLEAVGIIHCDACRQARLNRNEERRALDFRGATGNRNTMGFVRFNHY